MNNLRDMLRKIDRIRYRVSENKKLHEYDNLKVSSDTLNYTLMMVWEYIDDRNNPCYCWECDNET